MRSSGCGFSRSVVGDTIGAAFYAMRGVYRLLVLFNHLFQIIAHGLNRLAAQLHLTVRCLADDGVVLAEAPIVLVWIIFAEMSAARFLAIEAAQHEGFADREQVGKIKRGVPTRVVFAIAR